MNVINTIADKEDVGITIESKSIDNTELGITDVATQNTMLVVFVIVILIAILLQALFSGYAGGTDNEKNTKILIIVCAAALILADLCVCSSFFRRATVRHREQQHMMRV